MPGKESSILIVEDERPVRSLLLEVLGSKFECSAAANASDAISLLESHSFHLALVDSGLPGMSGLALSRLIANRFPGIAVVVISGNTDSRSIAEAMNAGAIDYITKPFDLSTVVATVTEALKRKRPGEVA